jgi:hypothetical protein
MIWEMPVRLRKSSTTEESNMQVPPKIVIEERTERKEQTTHNGRTSPTRVRSEAGRHVLFCGSDRRGRSALVRGRRVGPQEIENKFILVCVYVLCKSRHNRRYYSQIQIVRDKGKVQMKGYIPNHTHKRKQKWS